GGPGARLGVRRGPVGIRLAAGPVVEGRDQQVQGGGDGGAPDRRTPAGSDQAGPAGVSGRAGDGDPDRTDRLAVLRVRAGDPGGGQAPVGGAPVPGTGGEGGGHLAVDGAPGGEQVGRYAGEGRLQVGRVHDQAAPEHGAGSRYVDDRGGEQSPGQGLLAAT